MLSTMLTRLLSVFLLTLPLSLMAKPEFERVVPPVPTSNPDKIEVVELFWYGCPHCYRLEPALQRWLRNKPADVEYVRVPAILPESWALLARAYYAAESLGVVEQIHQPLFDAYHAERRPLRTEDQVAEFFADQGVDKEAFRRAFRSFAVDGKVRKAKNLTKRYGINGVPALIVNGRWRTGPSLTRTNANLMRVLNQLIEQERAAR